MIISEFGKRLKILMAGKDFGPNKIETYSASLAEKDSATYEKVHASDISRVTSGKRTGLGPKQE
ncbi:MAG: hypothetical protein ACFFC6_11290 [Promethearchaeota archaeon]